MATRPIKKYIKEKSDAYEDLMESSDRVRVKGKGVGRQYKTKKLRKFMEKADDVERLMKRKPKGMSDQEWMRQIESGEAMVQGARRSRRTKHGLFTHGLQKIVPSGPKKPKEFVITTMREPERIKNPKRIAKLRSELRRKQEREMRQENQSEPRLLKKAAKARTKQRRRK